MVAVSRERLSRADKLQDLAGSFEVDCRYKTEFYGSISAGHQIAPPGRASRTAEDDSCVRRDESRNFTSGPFLRQDVAESCEALSRYQDVPNWLSLARSAHHVFPGQCPNSKRSPELLHPPLPRATSTFHDHPRWHEDSEING